MSYVSQTLEQLKKKTPGEPEFIQAATEVLTSLEPVIEANPKYEAAGILERIVEPERQIMFRVSVKIDVLIRMRWIAAWVC